MSERRPIDAKIQGPEEVGPEEAGAEAGAEERFKEALSYRAAGVSVVSLRDDGRVHATTVSSFIPVSAAPPTLLVSVGGNAQIFPFLDEGTTFVVNILRADQRRLATVYSDSFPVGPSPFPVDGDPVIPECLAWLTCRVERLIETGGGILVLSRVVDSTIQGGGDALVHYRRAYHPLSETS